MTNTPLPKELRSLIHQTELNNADWRTKCLQQCILVSIWLSDGARSLQKIQDGINQTFAINPDRFAIESQLKSLCESGELVRVPEDRYKVSEQKAREIEEQVQAAEENETRAKAKFLAALGAQGLDLEPDKTWASFNEQFLVPLVHELGATTYDLICGPCPELHNTRSYSDFEEFYSPETRHLLRSAIIDFFDPKDANVRSYILEYLDAFYFLESSNLTEDHLNRVMGLSSDPPPLTVFVDTNFILSVLGFHEARLNVAASELMQLGHRVSKQVTVQFYALPITVSETKQTMRGISMDLGDVVLSPEVARHQLPDRLSGFLGKFAEAARKSGRSLRAEDYFGPYLSDLVPILKSTQIELYNRSLDSYGTKQIVIDDIATQGNYEEAHVPQDRRKSYEALRHDMIMWHFVNDMRPVNGESPLGAQYWVATEDQRFIRFDRSKGHESEDGIPLCVHPASLIQLLQFWVPRTPEFEEAVLSGMRAFVTHDFDPEAERVTIRIMNVLSRFENADDLTSDTATTLMMNQALRQRVSKAKDLKRYLQKVCKQSGGVPSL